MRQAEPEELLLTHFGRVDDVTGHFAALEQQHRVWSESILEGMNAGEDDEALAARIRVKLSRDGSLRAEGASEGTIARHSVTSSAEMTVMGVKRYWKKVHPERLEV